MLFYQKKEISHSDDMAQLVGAKVKATDFNYETGYCKKNTKDMQPADACSTSYGNYANC